MLQLARWWGVGILSLPSLTETSSSAGITWNYLHPFMGTLVKHDLLHILEIFLHWGEESSHCSWVGVKSLLHHSCFCAFFFKTKFTAGWNKTGKEARGKKQLKTHFRLQKEKTRTYWCLCGVGRDKAFHTWVSRDNGCMSQGYSGLLLELYSTLASWLKIAPWIEGAPSLSLTTNNSSTCN